MTIADKPLVTVPVADLLRVTPFKARDDVRYCLNGVLVTPYEDHALLVATNGHWMAIYESEHSHTDQDRILELPHWFVREIELLHAGKLTDADDEEEGDGTDSPSLPLVLRVANETSRLIISDAVSERLVKPDKPFVDGKFPLWRKVLPDPASLKPGLFTPFAASYLSGLHKAVLSHEFNHPLFCYQTPDDPMCPAVFRFGNLPQLILVLMPRRDDDCRPDTWPAWFAMPKEMGGSP